MDGKSYINPYKQFVGSWLPRWLEERPELTPGAKLVYARLASYAGKRGVAYPRQDIFARSIGVSAETLRRKLRELREVGLIEVRQRGTRRLPTGKTGRPAEYRFLDHVWITAASKIARATLTGQSTVARSTLTGQQPTPPKDRARAAFRESYTEEKQRSAPRGRATPGNGSPRDPGKPHGRGFDRAQRLVASVAGKLSTDLTRR